MYKVAFCWTQYFMWCSQCYGIMQLMTAAHFSLQSHTGHHTRVSMRSSTHRGVRDQTNNLSSTSQWKRVGPAQVHQEETSWLLPALKWVSRGSQEVKGEHSERRSGAGVWLGRELLHPVKTTTCLLSSITHIAEEIFKCSIIYMNILLISFIHLSHSTCRLGWLFCPDGNNHLTSNHVTSAVSLR